MDSVSFETDRGLLAPFIPNEVVAFLIQVHLR